MGRFTLFPFNESVSHFVLDFTEVANNGAAGIDIQIYPHEAGNKISIIGEEGKDYPIEFIIKDHPDYPSVDIYLENFFGG